MSVLKNSLYHLADLLVLNRGIPRTINHHRVRFPAKWSRYFEPDYEKDNIDFLAQTCKKGMTVVDIGAHLGLMSVIVSKLVGSEGTIYAFEPTPSTFRVFQKVIRLNHAEKIIRPFRMAISNFTGQIDFFVDEHEGSNANSLVSRQDKSRQASKTEVTTLDNFVNDQKITALHLLKIDAEGSELDVLRGAKKTILQLRPKIILALHPPLIKNNGQSTEEIYNLIGELNYTITYKGETLSKEKFCSETDFFDVHLSPASA